MIIQNTTHPYRSPSQKSKYPHTDPQMTAMQDVWQRSTCQAYAKYFKNEGVKWEILCSQRKAGVVHWVKRYKWNERKGYPVLFKWRAESEKMKAKKKRVTRWIWSQSEGRWLIETYYTECVFRSLLGPRTVTKSVATLPGVHVYLQHYYSLLFLSVWAVKCRTSWFVLCYLNDFLVCWTILLNYNQRRQDWCLNQLFG